MRSYMASPLKINGEGKNISLNEHSDSNVTVVSFNNLNDISQLRRVKP